MNSNVDGIRHTSKCVHKLVYVSNVYNNSECTSQAGVWADDTCPVGAHDMNCDDNTPVANNINGASAHINRYNGNKRKGLNNAMIQNCIPCGPSVSLNWNNDKGGGGCCLLSPNMFKVHFTNWQFILDNTGARCYIVSIPELRTEGNQTTFYYFHTLGTNSAIVSSCDTVPNGMLTIVSSSWWMIALYENVYTGKYCGGKANPRVDPKIAYENFQKDQVVQKYFHMPYVDYMQCIIDNIITHQDNLMNKNNDSLTQDHAQGHTTERLILDDFNTHNQGNASEYVPIDTGPDLDCYTKQGATGVDIYQPNKAHGHFTLSSDTFEFVGPDREPVEASTKYQYLNIAETIRRTGLPNYRGARIPIKSGLNINAWEHHLKDYPNKHLLQYLKFGFPLSAKNTHLLNNTDIDNHFSAREYPDQVNQYIEKEKSLGAMIGPFDAPPSAYFHCSPLLTRPKEADKRRIILNLSYPKGNSVNDMVDRDHFDGQMFRLKFPTIDDITQECLSIGSEARLAKIDVARAFRNLRIDPSDALKFGIKWQGQYFLDKGVAFGWVHGSSAFQLVSDAVTYIVAKRHHKVLAYIDDYIIISHKDTAQCAFDDLYHLLQDLGLPICPEKLNPPCKTLTCLGICVNLYNNTLSIDSNKLQEIYMECLKFHTKKRVSRRAFQSLLGKLLYIHKCVPPARIFINRMLSVFRDTFPNDTISLTSQFFRDLEWFITFLPKFNGVTFISKTVIPHDHTLHIDASLTGLGGIWSNRVYATPIVPLFHFTLKIVHLEMLNILVAMRKWKRFWSHSKVKIFCDNMAVVQVVGSGKAKDPYLAACLRNLWLLTASFDIELTVEHIQGVKNTTADFLSRLYSNNGSNMSELARLQKEYIWEPISIKDLTVNFSI